MVKYLFILHIHQMMHDLPSLFLFWKLIFAEYTKIQAKSGIILLTYNFIAYIKRFPFKAENNNRYVRR